MHVRPARMEDRPAIWRIIGPTIRAGETYALDRDMTEADALAYWLAYDRETFVAEEDGEIVGTVRIDDTVWRVSGPDCPAGSRVKVASADGVNLTVEASA